ncbi:hypothetical protein D770_04955 [Flammeovirgaceae bacterium 311]|nr:hypothetical protein D770_04955 [Flammeovirgaceae bacterium 311]
MKRNSQSGLLTAPLFLVGLFCLLINDFILKYEFSNALTGKLSDFAGLFIFPFFFSAYKPKKAIVIYLATAIIFVFWKSPQSQGLIDAFNDFGIELHRTVDYSDLLALIVLPLSFKYFRNQQQWISYNKRPIVLLISAASVFSFCATTLAGKTVALDIDTNKSYVVDMNKWELLNSLSAGVLPNGSSQYTSQEDLDDSLYYLTYYFPDIDAHMRVLAVIQQRDSNTTVIHLDQIISGIVNRNSKQLTDLKSMKAREFEQSFDTYFIQQINKDSLGPLTFYNKRIFDQYEK